MNRGDVGLVLGLAGFLLGGAAIFIAAGSQKETSGRWDDIQGMVKADEESITGLGEKVKGLDATVKDLTRRVNAVDTSPRQSAGGLKDLEDRIAALEAARGAAPDPHAKDPGTGPSGGASGGADEFDALSKKMLSDEATPDEMAKFWAMLREKPAILADWMSALEKEVADNPRDVDARMKLAQTYVVKLLTVPSGPEMGAWSMKAMEQYKSVLAQEPNHWDARYSLAFNYSQWPDFLNKRPDAIKEFETLRKVQENATPAAKHAQTYLQLRELYLKDGKPDDAKAVLDEGLRRFPDDEELKKAKDGAK